MWFMLIKKDKFAHLIIETKKKEARILKEDGGPSGAKDIFFLLLLI